LNVSVEQKKTVIPWAQNENTKTIR